MAQKERPNISNVHRRARRRAFTLGLTIAVCALLAPHVRAADSARQSADGIWATGSASPARNTLVDLGLERYQTVELAPAALDAVLAAAPLENSVDAGRQQAVILLPMPDGSFARFRFVESPILAPELAEAYPELHTYAGQGLDDPRATVRFDRTPAGFHAQILSPHGAVYIDPASLEDAVNHVSYYKRDFRRAADDFACAVASTPAPDDTNLPTPRVDSQMRTYRLAVAATQEYTNYHGGTVLAGMAAITTAINRVTGLYETEFGIRFTIVANNDALIYTSEPDPYTNGSSSTLISQNQANIDAIIGDGNYDIGHVFATGGGGLATLGTVCQSGQKAQAATGISNPIGDPFYIDYVSHEFGHQFSAQHTFNSVTGFCGNTGQRVLTSAYEPGSGSTIMAYPGICGTDNLQAHADPFFHSESIRQIRNFITFGSGSTCGSTTANGNTNPTVNAGANYTIPRQTPFTLTAAGSDSDGDPLTYSWEERDLGPAAAVTDPDAGSGPLFRCWPPTSDPTRTFPRLAELLNNTTPFGEQLPNSQRILNFRVVVRDNRTDGGGLGEDDMQVAVDATAGPFTVSSPNTGSEVWTDSGTVTWNVANTNVGAVSAASVDIMLSTNGGLTFPVMLAAGTPNDGSEAVSFSVGSTTHARVKVAAVGNIFFDVSNADFTINSPALLIDLPNGAPAAVAPGVPTPFDVEITPLNETPVPAETRLFYRFDGGAYASTLLTPQGGNLYTALLPRAVCSDTPEFYISVEGDLGTVVTDPPDAPATVNVATVGVVLAAFADDFETDQGWTVSASSGAVDGNWERGVPVNQDRGDPPADFDGSGQCYVTENGTDYPANDVDNGYAYLRSPVIDVSAGGTLHFAVWLNDYPAAPSGTMGPEDGLLVEYATDAAGTNWQTLRSYSGGLAAWREETVEIGSEIPASATFHLRFTAYDIPPGDVVEAGVDAVSITAFNCPAVGDGDFDSDGDVDLADFAALQTCWTAPVLAPACEPGDLNGDDALDTVDLDIFTQILGGP
ncbi:MAG TPA: M12 family metallo-peptidase [Phycisphaerae bacterium]|nr:zinc-dependent metalloprotease [Phycisphaerales bacterium]HRX84061.1 M12 family metallo-peptidase [Phycisphaerae bacterium]